MVHTVSKSSLPQAFRPCGARAARRGAFGRSPFLRRGFTLIELMIVVVVIAILASIAFPSYERYVTNSWRAKAAGCVSEVAQAMERRFTARLSYVGSSSDFDPLTLGCVTEIQNAGRYTFALDPAPTTTTYTVVARPTGRQADRETRCGTMTLNQAGVKTASGSLSGGECL